MRTKTLNFFTKTAFTIFLLVLVSILGCNNTSSEGKNETTDSETNDSSLTSTSQNNSKNGNKTVVSSGEVINISDEKFDNEIGKGVSLVDFWATWCMPCRMQGPEIEKVATEMAGKTKVFKMDVDKNNTHY